MEDIVWRLVLIALMLSVGLTLAGYGVVGQVWGPPAFLIAHTLLLLLLYGSGTLGTWVFMSLPVVICLLLITWVDRRFRGKPVHRSIRLVGGLIGTVLVLAVHMMANAG